jgi:tetratricopeptide (TPR) repeat protein
MPKLPFNLPSSETRTSPELILGICLLLTAASWFVFAQTFTFEFVNFDDPDFVYQVPEIAAGLTWHGVFWAFTHIPSPSWYPLTSITHMLDFQLYGFRAGGHHFTNVLLHIGTVILLFLLLREMTGALWRSAFVAAVWAIHPLRVESVAWVIERKDTLSGLFFVVTLGAYLRYVRKRTLGRYVTMSVLFACGLMSKPMLVTLPFVLLLLDYWPLRRIEDGRHRTEDSDCRASVSDAAPADAVSQRRPTIDRNLPTLLLEKVPLFALSVGSAIATSVAIVPADLLPLSWRIENAFVSYAVYISQTFWPVKLAVFYPHPQGHLAFWQPALAIAFLTAVTLTALALRKRYPYLVVGWLWYLVMLLPVSGVMQINLQAHADRYTYLPQIGLLIAFVWGAVDLTKGRVRPNGGLSARWRHRKPVLAMTAIVIVAVLAGCARRQTSYWKNSETLWMRTLAVTSNNILAHNDLGTFYEKSDRLDASIAQYEAALKIAAAETEAQYGSITTRVHYNLGYSLFRKGQLDDAIAQYQEALRLVPRFVDAHFILGMVLFQKGQLDEAIAQWRTTLLIQPNYAEAHTGIGNAVLRKGSLPEAIGHYEKAIAGPRPAQHALNNLAWILSTCLDGSFRNGPRGVELARQAVQLTHGENSGFLRTLAAAYAEAGRFNDAIETANRALQTANAQHDADLANKLQHDLDLYRVNSPLRERSPTNIPAAP